MRRGTGRETGGGNGHILHTHVDPSGGWKHEQGQKEKGETRKNADRWKEIDKRKAFDGVYHSLGVCFSYFQIGILFFLKNNCIVKYNTSTPRCTEHV